MLKKIPNTFIIIFALILISAILTWIIPGGIYTSKQNTTAIVSLIEISTSKSDSVIHNQHFGQSLLQGEFDKKNLTTKSYTKPPIGSYLINNDSIAKFKWSFGYSSNANDTLGANAIDIAVYGNYAGNNKLEFQEINNSPQSFQVFTAFQKGFSEKASIIIFVLIVGGVFWIVNNSRAIDAGIYTLLRRLKRLDKNTNTKPVFINNIILVIIMLVFSAFGAIFGMSEETIAFVGILIPLTISMGYDSITGVAVVFVAACLGFAGAILNPFTIGIAQEIAGIPMFSGIEYRFFCWIALNIIGFSYILWYANKIHANPERSPSYEIDEHWRNRAEQQKSISYYKSSKAWRIYFVLQIATIAYAVIFPITTIKLGNTEKELYALPILSILFGVFCIITLRKSVHFFILNLLFFTILYLLIGVMGFDWYINEISALFLVLGISSGIAMKKSGNEIVKLFMEGAKDILSAALIIGLAAGIVVILKEGQIIDSILHSAANSMQGLGKSATIGMIYTIQTFLNVIIPSGSAQAAITMPIMAPFSDLVSLSKQATVVAFQFGDGFTNMITPTSGVLMAVLGVSKIPYAIWVKWISPLLLILIAVGFLLLLPTVHMDLNGF